GMDGRVPVEAQLLVVARLGLDVAVGARPAIDPPDESALRLGIDRVGTARVHQRPESVAPVEILPGRVGDAAGPRRVTHPGAVVLQAAVHLVRVLVVDAHVIELRDGKVVALPPAVAAVVGNPQAAVVSADDMLRILRIDPEIVPVAVRAAAAAAEAAATVLAGNERVVGLE